MRGMTPPVLLVVEEDPDVLAALETQLVKRYARDYRVECLGDPERALGRLADLARRRRGRGAVARRQVARRCGLR